jgi:hypothetical protein
MLFLRHGSWCSKCGRSWNSAGLGRLEAGLSVYECVESGPGQWEAVKSHAWTKNCTAVIGSETPWFLVDGAPSERPGGDQEPLIHNARFVCALRRDGERIFRESKDPAPTPRDHPKSDDAGTCRDWNSTELANREHEVAGDEAYDEGEHDDADDVA